MFIYVVVFMVVIILSILVFILFISPRGRGRFPAELANDLLTKVLAKQGHREQLGTLWEHYHDSYQQSKNSLATGIEPLSSFPFVYIIDHYYVQGFCDIDGTMHIEITGNDYLPEDRKLTEVQLEELEKLGWMIDSTDNFYVERPINSRHYREELLNLIDKSLAIYGITPQSKIDISIIG